MLRSRFDEITSAVLIRVMTKRRRRGYLTPVGIFRMTRCNNVIVADDGAQRARLIDIDNRGFSCESSRQARGASPSSNYFSVQRSLRKSLALMVSRRTRLALNKIMHDGSCGRPLAFSRMRGRAAVAFNARTCSSGGVKRQRRSNAKTAYKIAET
jgi:hypothetical protein